jgi:hypothetical protein
LYGLKLLSLLAKVESLISKQLAKPYIATPLEIKARIVVDRKWKAGIINVRKKNSWLRKLRRPLCFDASVDVSVDVSVNVSINVSVNTGYRRRHSGGG